MRLGFVSLLAASIAHLTVGCAEDRILEAGAVCGDLRLSQGEQCDVDSDGCQSCRVTLGWRCDTETCSTQCGDGIVAGAEECDPPDEKTCDGACFSAVKTEACDMTGWWMARETNFSIDDVVSQVQTSSVWHLWRIEQLGSAFEIKQSLVCGIEVTGIVRVTLTAGGERGLMYRNAQDGSGGHPARRGTFESSGTDSCSFSLERYYAVRGLEDRYLPADFSALPDLDSLEPLPVVTDPTQSSGAVAGAVDDDGDGHPGIAWQLSGNLTGRRNTGQRDHTEYFPDPAYVIRQHAFELVARGTFDNQETILYVNDCPDLGCGLLLGGSVPAQNLAHRIMLRYLGKAMTDARVAAVVVADPRSDPEADLQTCAMVRLLLPHDPSKE